MKKWIGMSLVAALGLLGACKSNKEGTQTSGSKKIETKSESLEGTWELDYVLRPGQDFDKLYPDRKPEITFHVADKTLSGYTGCNSFNGSLDVNGHKINFVQPMAMTKKACMGDGEPVFLKVLSAVTSYDVMPDGKTLNFISGDIATMRFIKKQ